MNDSMAGGLVLIVLFVCGIALGLYAGGIHIVEDVDYHCRLYGKYATADYVLTCEKASINHKE